MADKKPTAAPAQTVDGFDKFGKPVTVDASDVEALKAYGGRVATAEDLAQAKMEQRYEAQGALGKVGAFAGLGVLPPALQALREGGEQGAGAGLTHGIIRQGIQQFDPKVAETYAQQREDVRTANETAFKAGEVGGLIASSVATGGVGGGSAATAARLAPGALVSRAGAGAAGVAAKALGGTAAKGALGRALATGLEVGAQGATEGALLGAGQSVGEDMLGDHKVNAEKLWAAAGNGALTGFAAGAALGAGGSLVKSGAEATVGAARSGLSRVLTKGQTAATDAVASVDAKVGSVLDSIAQGERAATPTQYAQKFGKDIERARPFVDPYAGLEEAAPEAARPFKIGKPGRGAWLDEDAGLVGEAEINSPFKIGKPKAIGKGNWETPGEVGIRMQEGAEVSPNPLSVRRSGKVELQVSDAADAAAHVPIRTRVEGVSPSDISRIRSDIASQQSTGAYKVADELAFKALGASKTTATKIGDDAAAVGNWVNRNILKTHELQGDALTSAISAGKVGRPDQMLPAAIAKRAELGDHLGSLIKPYDVDIPLANALKPVESIQSALSKNPATVDAGRMLAKNAEDLQLALANAGKINADGTVKLSDLYQARAQLEGKAMEHSRLGLTDAKQAVKDWTRQLDDMLVSESDRAAKIAGRSGQAEALLAAKREYSLASKAISALEDGAKTIGGRPAFGLMDAVAVAGGMAGGGPLGAITGAASAVGQRMLRDRGSAAAAAGLSRMADLGTIARARALVDEQVSRASKGILLPPASKQFGARQSGNVVSQARRIISDVRAAQADAEGHAERVSQRVAGLGATAPRTADALTSQTAAAIAMLSSEIPAKVSMSPMRTANQEPLSPMVAHKIVTMAKYINEPLEFFRDVENGYVSPEGVKVIAQLMPQTYQQLQVLTLEEIGAAQAKGKPIDFNTRIRLSTLLDVPGDASMKPEFAKMLQQNVTTPPPEQSAPSGGGSSSSGSLTKPAVSGLDRIESR